MGKRLEWTDDMSLEVLHMVENQGMTYEQAASFIPGATRMSIAGLIKRVKLAMDGTDPDGNQNGTMPEKWWKR